MKVRVADVAKEFGLPLEEVLAHLTVLGEEPISAGSLLESTVEHRLREKLTERAMLPAGAAVYTADPGEPAKVSTTQPVPPAASRRPAVGTRSVGRGPRVANNPFGVARSSFADGRAPAPRPGAPRPQPTLDTFPARSTPQAQGRHKGEPLPSFMRLILDEHLVPRRMDDGPYKRQPPSGYYQSEIDEARKIVQDWAPTLFRGLSQDDVLRWVSSDLGIEPEQALALSAAGLQPRDIDRSYANDGRPTLATRLKKGLASVEEVIRLALKQKELRTKR